MNLAINFSLVLCLWCNNIHICAQATQPAQQSRADRYFNPNLQHAHNLMALKQAEHNAQVWQEMNECVERVNDYVSKFTYFDPVVAGKHTARVIGENICADASVFINDAGKVYKLIIGNTSYPIASSESVWGEHAITISAYIWSRNNPDNVLVYFYNNFYNDSNSMEETTAAIVEQKNEDFNTTGFFEINTNSERKGCMLSINSAGNIIEWDVFVYNFNSNCQIKEKGYAKIEGGKAVGTLKNGCVLEIIMNYSNEITINEYGCTKAAKGCNFSGVYKKK